MAIYHTLIDDFLKLAAKHPVIDVRSPREFDHAHIPGAHSIPIFSDDERAEIGTTYKQVGQEDAIKMGLIAFGPKLKSIIEKVEALMDKNGGKAGGKGSVLVHCWRGGMRSSAVAWLLDLYGFNVHLLDGGYKRYRRWVLRILDGRYNFNVIGGFTGSGKTALLHTLEKSGHAVLDLEAIAAHKGSAFGRLADVEQPRQEQFENDLAGRLCALTCKDPDRTIYVEDESQRIGAVNIPASVFTCMQKRKLYFLEIPFEKRLEYILQDYGKLSTEIIISGILRIQKRLGPLETKTALECLSAGDLPACFRILLGYYDKHYCRGIEKRRPHGGLHIIECLDVHPLRNTKTLIMHLMNAHAIA